MAGQQVALTSLLVRPPTVVTTSPVANQSGLVLEWTDKGLAVLEQVTSRLAQQTYPLAVFLDGEPLRDTNGLTIAPHVQEALHESVGIYGLHLETIEQLSTLLNAGAFPIPMHIVRAEELREQ